MGNTDDGFTLVTGKAVSVLESATVELSEYYGISHAIYMTRQMATKAGFMLCDATMIATAVSELSTNIIRYAKKGEIRISIIKNINNSRKGIELFADDNGPGIQDIDRAMQEQYSSLPNSLGLGLPSVKRIMDDFYIESILGRGTRVLARKWKR